MVFYNKVMCVMGMMLEGRELEKEVVTMKRDRQEQKSLNSNFLDSADHPNNFFVTAALLSTSINIEPNMHVSDFSMGSVTSLKRSRDA